MAVWDTDETNLENARREAANTSKYYDHEKASDEGSSIEVQIIEKGLTWFQVSQRDIEPSN